MKKDIRKSELSKMNIELLFNEKNINDSIYFINEFEEVEETTIKDYVSTYQLDLSTTSIKNGGKSFEFEIGMDCEIIKKDFVTSEKEVLFSFSNFDTCEFAYYAYIVYLCSLDSSIPNFTFEESDLF